MAAFHEYVAPIAGESRVNVGLAGQQGVGIRAGAVGLVAELDAAKIALGPLPTGLGLSESLARPRWRGRQIILSVDSLQRGVRGPGLQQGAFHREMLVAEQRIHLRSCHQLLQEPAHHLLVEQAHTIHG
jgi:hypothetical protein